MKKPDINIKKIRPALISIAVGAAILGSAYAYKAYTEHQAIEKAENAKEEMARNAKAADTLIEKIGDVTIDSGKAIAKAEKSYAKLSEDEKSLVKKYDDLVSARKQYDDLVSEKAEAESISKEIDNIGDVTIDKKEQIQSLSGRYSALSDFGKSYVKNYDTLKEKEESLNAIIEEANTEINDEVASEKKAEDDKLSKSSKTKKAESKDAADTSADVPAKSVESAKTETASTVSDTNGNSVTIDNSNGAKTEDLGPDLGTATTYADGTVQVKYANGNVMTQNTDGSTRLESPDGKYAVFDANGVIIDKNYEFDNNATLEIGN